MGKNQSKRKQIKALQKSAKLSPQERLDRFMEQERYIQALDLVRQVQKSSPDAPLTPSEGAVLLRLGQEELERSQYKAADARFTKALDLASPQDDWLGDAYYWSAKSLVSQDRCDEALSLIQTAFEQEKLPKSQGGCYLKLLLIQGQSEAVKRLIAEQPKRFYATQLHWARGILALQDEQPEAAVAHFRKGKDPVTPGDTPKAWLIYARQCQSDWSGAISALHQLRNSRSPNLQTQTALVKWLDLNQRINTGRLRRSPFERRLDIEVSPMLQMLEVVGLLEDGNVHDAGHAFLGLDAPNPVLPELQALNLPLMRAAGDQSVTDDQLDCAANFWEQIADEKPLDFQLNINLLYAYGQIGDEQACISTLQRLIHWVEKEAQAQGWPASRCNVALVQLHCRLTDFYMFARQEILALKALKEAEKIDAQHPELLARRGLMRVANGDVANAIPLLTEAFEKGCKFDEAYETLLQCLEKIGDKAAKKEIRQRFGRRFGDLVEAEIDGDLPRWLEAISTQKYLIFESLIHPEDAEGPEELACGEFRDAVEGEPNKSGRVDVDLEAVGVAWDELLKRCSTEEQVNALEAISLCLQLFCKRVKGRDAMIKHYQEQLLSLESELPAALKTYLVVCSLKNTATAVKQMQPHLERYLKRSPEPGTALAQVQLRARWFGNGNALQPAVEAALKKEPQNPQLLLAKATFYGMQSNPYEQHKEQGFDIARRLQDAPALQAFRDEQVFVAHWQTTQAMPKNLRNFDTMNLSDMERMLEQMIRNMLGPQVSEQELRALMPMLKEQLLNEATSGGFEFADEGRPLPLPIDLFGPPPSRRGGKKKKSARRRRRG